MANKFFIFVISIIMINRTAQSQGLGNDMLRQTISVQTIPKKWLQMETGIGLQISKVFSSRTTMYSHPSLSTRYGLNKRVELRFSSAFLSRHYKFSNATETRKQTISGWNNIQIGGKISILQNFKKLPDISFTAHYRINNKDWRGRSGPITDTINGGNFRFSFQNRFSENFQLDYSAGIDWISWKSHERYIYTMSPLLHFNEKWSGYLEASGIIWNDYKPLHFIRAGGRFSPVENYSFDLIFGKAWNRKESHIAETYPSGEVALQFSWRFNTATK